MKKFLNEFKEFAMRGNVIDLAVGVIIGGAFQTIVNSLLTDVINPLIGMLFKADLSYFAIPLPYTQQVPVVVDGVEKMVGQTVMLNIGLFITAVINFIIMAFVIFLMVKFINKITSIGKKPDPIAVPTTKKCPFCCSEIDINAVKCAHCASELPEEAAE